MAKLFLVGGTGLEPVPPACKINIRLMISSTYNIIQHIAFNES